MPIDIERHFNDRLSPNPMLILVRVVGKLVDQGGYAGSRGRGCREQPVEDLELAVAQVGGVGLVDLLARLSIYSKGWCFW